MNADLPNKNATFKKQMTSLNKLVLVEATEDTSVYPYQSEQFGGYAWNTTVCACDACDVAVECEVWRGVV